jgi:antitoxin MazE
MSSVSGAWVIDGLSTNEFCNYNVLMKTKSSRPKRPVTPAPKRGLRPAGPRQAIKSKLVRIGNSRGIRLPKALLEQAELSDEVTLRVRGRSIIIEPAKHPRAGWEEAMKAAVAEGNDLTAEDREWLDAPLDPELDEKEWTW